MSTLPEILIRDMGPDDVPAVLQLEQQAYPFPWTDGIFRDCLRVGYYSCVAELEHILIGYAVLSTGANEAHVLNLCVAEPYRCRGIGAAMLEHLLEFSKSMDVTDVFLEVRPSNPAAIRLYQAHGFSQIGVRPGYYQAVGGREDAVVLRRTLGKRRR
jgi:[ribosomal protein S18]-alanine N-acetyltransferase